MKPNTGATSHNESGLLRQPRAFWVAFVISTIAKSETILTFQPPQLYAYGYASDGSPFCMEADGLESSAIQHKWPTIQNRQNYITSPTNEMEKQAYDDASQFPTPSQQEKMRVASGAEDGRMDKGEEQEPATERQDYITGFRLSLLLSALTSAALVVLIDTSIVSPVRLL